MLKTKTRTTSTSSWGARVAKFRNIADDAVDDDEFYRVADAAQPRYADAAAALIARLQAAVDALLGDAFRTGDSSRLGGALLAEEARIKGEFAKDDEGLVLTQIELDVMSEAALAAGTGLDLIDPLVVAAARTNAAALVTSVAEQARQSVRDAVTAGVAGDMTRSQVERSVRGAVGMSGPQHRSYLNLQRAMNAATQVDKWDQLPAAEKRLLRRVREYKLLDGRLSKPSPGMSRAHADKIMERYEQRAIRHRAETIARTETMRAANAGKVEGMRQATRNGFVTGVEKVWATGIDDRTCVRCIPLDGMVIALDADFVEVERGGVDGKPVAPLPPGVTGAKMDFPPLHGRCRCTVTFRNVQIPTGGTLTSAPRTGEPGARVPSVPRGARQADDVGEIGMGRSEPLDPDLWLDRSGNTSASPHIRNGQWTAERAAIHDDIVRSILDDIPVSDDPTFTMMGGGSAAGKGHHINGGHVRGIKPGRYAKIDSDEIKRLLPETDRMIAAGDETWAAFTHEESSYLAKRTMRAARERRVDYMLDGTGDGSVGSVMKKIEEARAAGYKTNGAYVTVPYEEALAREAARAAATGRKVPLDILHRTHGGVSRVLPEVVDEFDTIALFDTSTEIPTLILRGEGGVHRIVNRSMWDDFRAKGSATIDDLEAIVARQTRRSAASTLHEIPDELDEAVTTAVSAIDDLIVPPEVAAGTETRVAAFQHGSENGAFDPLYKRPPTRAEIRDGTAFDRPITGRITLSPNDSASGQAFTFAHEYGHALDISVTARGEVLSRVKTAADVLDEAESALLRRALASDRSTAADVFRARSWDDLVDTIPTDQRAAAEFVFHARDASSEAIKKLSDQRYSSAWRDYAKSPEELWARAFSQRVATNGNADELLREVRRVRRIQPGYQWADDEFELLAPRVDAVLREWGLLR
jgi:predicted ABC-type ATPase